MMRPVDEDDRADIADGIERGAEIAAVQVALAATSP